MRVYMWQRNRARASADKLVNQIGIVLYTRVVHVRARIRMKMYTYVPAHARSLRNLCPKRRQPPGDGQKPPDWCENASINVKLICTDRCVFFCVCGVVCVCLFALVVLPIPRGN